MCHAPSVGSIEPLTSPAIKSVTREYLNCTQVDAAHWLVLPTHTRVSSHSYFGCPAHTLGRRECAARRRASHHLACVGKAGSVWPAIIEAAVMIRLTARAQRPHRMLQPRQS